MQPQGTPAQQAEQDGEPRPVRLMNTLRADRTGVHDDLTTTADLTAWLAGAPATDADLAAFRALRRALRDLAALLTDDTRPLAAGRDVERAVAEVNHAATAAATWPQLALDGGLRRATTTDATPATAALAGTAAEAVDLFTGADRPLLRACYAPHCVRYFVKDHPRREWCSPGCGNRARAARHYRRTSATPE